jgi:hypothetical protein
MAQWRPPSPQEDDVANEDLKAKMREALDRKHSTAREGDLEKPVHQKAHGSEVEGGTAPKVHRRKAGGGGA